MQVHSLMEDPPLFLFTWVAGLLGTSTLTAACLSSFLLSSIVYLASGVFSRVFGNTYTKLPLRDQQRWNSGVNRACMGFTLACMGIRAFMEGVIAEDAVHGYSDFLLHTASFALGFFIFETRDSLNMFFAHGIMEETLIVHHIMGILLYFLTISTRSYLYAACICLMQEFSAPFVHIGWILTKTGRDNHWVWDLNQYVLVSVWIVFRQGVDILLWAHLLYNLPNGWLGGPFLPMAFITCGMFLLTGYLNPWWLMLKIGQFKKRDEKYARINAKKNAQNVAQPPSSPSLTDTQQPQQAAAGGDNTSGSPPASDDGLRLRHPQPAPTPTSTSSAQH